MSKLISPEHELQFAFTYAKYKLVIKPEENSVWYVLSALIIRGNLTYLDRLFNPHELHGTVYTRDVGLMDRPKSLSEGFVVATHAKDFKMATKFRTFEQNLDKLESKCYES